MRSSDDRFQCEKCGYRYIVFDWENMYVLEPKSQYPKNNLWSN